MFANIINIITRFYPMFLQGLGITLLLSFITVFFGTIFGTLVCFMKMSKLKILNILANIYIEIIRGTPLLLQLFIFVFFIVPDVLHLDISDFTAVAIALIVNSSAYVSEIVRSGINSVDNGQFEAGRSLGLNQSKTMVHIILPQAIKNILPTLGNEFVMVIKETSLASVFFVGDLMTTRNIINNITYMTIEPLIIVGIIYFMCTFSISKLIAYFEKRMKND